MSQRGRRGAIKKKKQFVETESRPLEWGETERELAEQKKRSLLRHSARMDKRRGIRHSMVAKEYALIRDGRGCNRVSRTPSQKKMAQGTS